MGEHYRLSAGLSRRVLLGGTAATLGLAGLPWALCPAHAADHFDLIVIGGGTAGLPAAIFAAARARVLIIEKGAVTGGTLDRSTGQLAAAGTVFQQARGISDSPDAHYEDIIRINGGTSDPALTRLFVDHAGEMLNWLAGNGYQVAPEHPVTGASHEHFTTPRYQWGTPGGWSIYRALEPALKQGVASGRITLQLNTRVIEIMTGHEGSVTGVLTENSAGERGQFQAPQIVIASGGCASNPALFEALHGIPLYAQVAHPNSLGDGLMLGLGAGGHLRGGDKYASLVGGVLAEARTPSALAATAPLNALIREPWEILVNARGERFVREDHPSIHALELAAAGQPGHQHWAIFDQQILDTAPPIIPRWSREQLLAATRSNPMFSAAETLDELAVRAGLDPRRLRATVAAYNDAREAERPDPFGLEHRPLPIARPPFYALRMQGWTLISFAGLAVNDRLQVIRENGAPIPGLYAAGEVIGAGATSGRAYTNGMLATPALTFGRLLGERLLPLD